MFSIETLTIFILSCFVGYYVVSKVSPALHAPLMSVTNAISSVIIAISLDAILINLHINHNASYDLSVLFCIVSIFVTMINIVGGFLLTKRMLKMFKKKKDIN